MTREPMAPCGRSESCDDGAQPSSRTIPLTRSARPRIRPRFGCWPNSVAPKSEGQNGLQREDDEVRRTQFAASVNRKRRQRSADPEQSQHDQRGQWLTEALRELHEDAADGERERRQHRHPEIQHACQPPLTCASALRSHEVQYVHTVRM